MTLERGEGRGEIKGGSRILKWEWGVNFCNNVRQVKYYFNIWGIKKKKERRGLRKRGVKIHPFHLPGSVPGNMSVKPPWSFRPACIAGFFSVKQLGVFLLHPGWNACPSQNNPPPPPRILRLSGSHLCTRVGRVEIGTVRVKCHAQEHNTMSTARVRTQTTQFIDEYINHDATVPPIRGV